MELHRGLSEVSVKSDETPAPMPLERRPSVSSVTSSLDEGETKREPDGGGGDGGPGDDKVRFTTACTQHDPPLA